MRFSRAHWIVGTAATCILFTLFARSRSVHTDDVKVETGRLTCKVVNPHDYPVEVKLEASFVSRKSSEHFPPDRIFESTSIVKIHPRTSKEVEFSLQDDVYYTFHAQVLVESVERLIDMEFE